MKIRAVETIPVGAGMRNWIFVKVTTDEGLVGWGEATTEWRSHSVMGAIQDVSPLLINEDPFRIEHLWQSMYRQQFWKGGVSSMSALSGIDQALYDIKAQALGVPIYELLGGRVRDRIRLYDHLGGGDPALVYGPLDPDVFADAAAQSADEGYTAVKLLAVPVGDMLASSAAVARSMTVMERVRDAVGPDIELMVDLHGRTTPFAAVQFGRALAPMQPWFLEEPCQPEDAQGMVTIAAHLDTPLATGERLFGRAQFQSVLETRAVAVIQPDVCHCGGLSEMKRIAALAETFGVAVAPHNPLGPIATAHNLHFAAATSNWLIQEQMRKAVPWMDDVVTAPPDVNEGFAAIPKGPGLGIAVDEHAAKRFPFATEQQCRSQRHDGAVADW